MAHVSEAELTQLLVGARSKVSIGSTYRHYKGGEYIVRDVLIIEADESVGVVYVAQYGERITFVRPLESWLETVEHNNTSMPRFSKS